MTGVRVEGGIPTPAGRVYPRYHEESGTLAVERRAPGRIDIDGTLICDMDERRLLVNCDVHAP